MEAFERKNDRLWVPHVSLSAWTGKDTAKLVNHHISKSGVKLRRVGLEYSFIPSDVEKALTGTAENIEYREALFVLKRLRARKTPAEPDLLRRASELVVESMLEVIATHGPGTTTQELFDALRREEEKRDLAFEYCLFTAGTSHNRAPSSNRWEEGGIITLDSGGNYGGYIGDLCRMAILGEPDAELVDLLGGIEDVQQAARKPIRAGALGCEVNEAGAKALDRLLHKSITHFVAHGMGLIPHEAPRLTGRGPVSYPGEDADRPLESGMVLSIETTLPHPKRGYIKLEDTVVVTVDSGEGFGGGSRGWNRGGTRV
jgi:Xaa-Pro aminopeptidase